MLYTFKSKATAHLIMLEANGTRLLQIIGKDAGPKGIVLPEQMPAALAALKQAVEDEDAVLLEAARAARESGEPLADPLHVTLRQRAAPFVEMLQRCHAAQEAIVWGV